MSEQRSNRQDEQKRGITPNFKCGSCKRISKEFSVEGGSRYECPHCGYGRDE